jgi:hypothetical protein
MMVDRLCGLVVRVPSYRSRGPGLIPCSTRFSETYCVWNGVNSASWAQLRSYLKEKVAENTALGGEVHHADRVAPSLRKSWH